MITDLYKDQILVKTVMANLNRDESSSVLTFDSPFSVLVMDRGFAMTETLVNEIKTFLLEQGLTQPVGRIAAVTSFQTDLDRSTTTSRTNTRLMVFNGRDKLAGKLDVVFFVGTIIEDANA